MPRNVRPFWVNVEADGYAKSVGMGPKNGNGGIFVTILQREKGSISDHKVTVRGYVKDKIAVLIIEKDGVEISRTEMEV